MIGRRTGRCGEPGEPSHVEPDRYRKHSGTAFSTDQGARGARQPDRRRRARLALGDAAAVGLPGRAAGPVGGVVPDAPAAIPPAAARRTAARPARAGPLPDDGWHRQRLRAALAVRPEVAAAGGAARSGL